MPFLHKYFKYIATFLSFPYSFTINFFTFLTFHVILLMGDIMDTKTMQERLTDLYAKEDIGMYYCGKRINTKNHIYGPEIRSHYLFVLVDKGKAVMLSHKRLSFGKHDLLVMFPNEKIHYKRNGALTGWDFMGKPFQNICLY